MFHSILSDAFHFSSTGSLVNSSISFPITVSFQFTIMFLPHESMLNAAIGTDPEILDYALINNIVLATPLTFFALLKVIQMSWKEDSMMRNSGELVKIAGNIYERMEGMYDRVNKIGKNINSLVYIACYFDQFSRISHHRILLP